MRGPAFRVWATLALLPIWALAVAAALAGTILGLATIPFQWSDFLWAVGLVLVAVAGLYALLFSLLVILTTELGPDVLASADLDDLVLLKQRGELLHAVDMPRPAERGRHILAPGF